MRKDTPITVESYSHLLEVRNLTKIFHGGVLARDGVVAVDNISFTLGGDTPTTLAIAGESGSGKTTLAQLILGFQKPTAGQIIFNDAEIQRMNVKNILHYRRQVQAIFQDPYQAFNPFYRIDHVFNVVIKRFNLARNKDDGRRITHEALNVVSLNPEEILGKYPHQLSGGQLQRIMIARAFLLKPQLIIADEPVSMIDASLRAIILKVMMDLKYEFGISQLYITHDLSTALQISDEIMILYQGSVVEYGNAQTVIQNPKHPYTQLLINSIPLPDPERKWESTLDTDVVYKSAPMDQMGCKFYERCPHRMDVCLDSHPPLYLINENQHAACYLYEDTEITNTQ